MGDNVETILKQIFGLQNKLALTVVNDKTKIEIKPHTGAKVVGLKDEHWGGSPGQAVMGGDSCF